MSHTDEREVRPSIVTRIEQWVAGLSLGLATLFVIVAVVMRYFFQYAPPHFEELTRYLIIWSVFVGASHLLHRNGHITIDVLIITLPVRARLVLQTFAYGLGVVFCVLIAYYGLQMVLQSYELGARSISSLRAPMWIPQLAVPLGAALMLLRFVEKIALHLRLLRSGRG
jgi:C4-dicarboxylate transporter, DctQ subunit